MTTEPFSAALLDELGRLSTCVVDSAIETFRVRLKNTGFTNAPTRCIFPKLPTMVGYAATARIRCSEPPMSGHSYYERMSWWDHVLSIPRPRVVVIQDLDDRPGLGAFAGEVNANILLAFGCVGMVTNGAVRDLEEVERTGFQMFAGNVSVSHAYAHVFDFGGAVEVGGLIVHPGDLIQGDRHGVQTIPREIAEQVPARAKEILECRRRIVEKCRFANPSAEELCAVISESELKC